jgi:hypothetical protein
MCGMTKINFIGKVETIYDLEYNPESCSSAVDFHREVRYVSFIHCLIISMRSDCLFAKKSLVWGSHDYDESLTIEQNLRKSLQAFVLFTVVGENQHLDGFLIQIKVFFGLFFS